MKNRKAKPMLYVVRRNDGAIFSIHFTASKAYATLDKLNKRSMRYWIERRTKESRDTSAISAYIAEIFS
jgi:hypothetical protein